MHWDDLKVLLALCRKRSARGAAQELGVSNSTITRRLDDLERQLGSQLFDRTPDGYRMTAAAEALLPTAEHVEELVLAAERQITGGDSEVRGSIRITLPEAAGLGRLMRHLQRFAEEYPGVELEILPSVATLDLSRREADIAIRVVLQGTPLPDYLIGRLIAPMTISTYVHRDLLNPDDPADIGHLTWIGKRPAGEKEEWLQYTTRPDLPVRHAIEDLDLLAAALQARMGMALMPCVAAAEYPDIVRVPGAPVRHHADIWVLTHKDLRMSARIRLARDVIAEAFESIKPLLDSRETA